MIVKLYYIELDNYNYMFNLKLINFKPFFTNVSFNRLKEINNYFEQKIYVKNDYIFKEG